MADDLLRKDLIAHKIYSAWQFIEYTEKNISTVQYCADTLNNIIGKMTMMNNPASMSRLSGNRKPQIRF